LRQQTLFAFILNAFFQSFLWGVDAGLFCPAINSSTSGVSGAAGRLRAPAQWKELRAAGVLPEPEKTTIQKGYLRVSIPANGLIVVEIK
jgi:hypothetical protein